MPRAHALGAALCKNSAVPELPEVETVRRQLEPALIGSRITGAWGFAADNFRQAPSAVGGQITAVERRGKYLLLALSRDAAMDREEHDRDLELIVHLGMTGRLAVASADRVPVGNSAEHLRAWWSLETHPRNGSEVDGSEVDGSEGDHRLWMWDVRRFGRVAVVPPGEYSELPTLAALGPEPLSDRFTPAGLRSAISGRKAIKTALLDQRAVAGVGNIYADEALWLAQISPFAKRISHERAVRLHEAVVAVLSAAVADGGTTLRDYRDASGERGTHQFRLNCYGRGSEPCNRCGAPLAHRFLDGRGTTWCKVCQH